MSWFWPEPFDAEPTRCDGCGKFWCECDGNDDDPRDIREAA